MNLIVVGASKGLGRALSEKLARNGHNLLLVASNEADLDTQAKDLCIRRPNTRVEYLAQKISCNKQSVDAIKSAAEKLGKIDGILFPIGFSRNDDDGTLACHDIEEILGSNLSGIMAVTSAFLPEFLTRNSGFFVFFGSVAAERGRSSNIAYAAAKRGLQSFYESVRHRCSATDVKVQYYQLGYLNTAQTFGKKLPFPAAEPDEAAAHIVGNLGKDFGQAYFPWFWRYICLALRFTPWFVFKKLKF